MSGQRTNTLAFQAGLLFFCVVLLSLPQAALLPLLDRDEPRFAEASREMLQSGNFVVPTFDHAPRYAKPPLIYWMQAASFVVFGENAFAARLPSLLATVGTAVLLLAWGVALGGSEIGWIAALSYAFCFQTIQQGRVATADALMIFFVALSAFAGWKMIESARLRGAWAMSRSWNAWGTVLAFAVALGFLAKGPEALLPMTSLLVFSRHGGWPAILRLLAILAVALLIVSAWAIPAYLQTNGAYWREGLGHDVGDRMVTSFQGHGSSSLGGYLLGLPYYVVLFWISALPWSPLLAIKCRALFSKRDWDFTDAYLLLNAALFFVIFSLLVTKLPHYTLPAFPFLALFFARRWIATGFSVALPIRLTAGFGTLLAALALIFIPLLVIPRADPSPTGELVRDAGPALQPDTQFALVDFQEPSTVWEMRRLVRTYSQTIPREQVLSFLSGPGSRAVLLTSDLWRQVSAVPHGPWKTFSAHGWNAAKGRFFDLTLVVNGK